MSVETYNPDQLIEVTASAAVHFEQQLARATSAQKGVRLSVKESGCTGYKYVLDMVDAPEADDSLLVLDNNVSVYIDTGSAEVVRGTRIDFVREGVNQQLVFINPNAEDYCGCGESFSVNQG